jgi:hypothetical protein
MEFILGGVFIRYDIKSNGFGKPLVLPATRAIALKTFCHSPVGSMRRD